MGEKTSASDQWKAEHTMFVGLRIQNASGIPESLRKALEQTGKTKNGYIIEAIREKLIHDGFAPNDRRKRKTAE